MNVINLNTHNLSLLFSPFFELWHLLLCFVLQFVHFTFSVKCHCWSFLFLSIRSAIHPFSPWVSDLERLDRCAVFDCTPIPFHLSSAVCNASSLQTFFCLFLSSIPFFFLHYFSGLFTPLLFPLFCTTVIFHCLLVFQQRWRMSVTCSSYMTVAAA